MSKNQGSLNSDTLSKEQEKKGNLKSSGSRFEAVEERNDLAMQSMPKINDVEDVSNSKNMASSSSTKVVLSKQPNRSKPNSKGYGKAKEGPSSSNNERKKSPNS